MGRYSLRIIPGFKKSISFITSIRCNIYQIKFMGVAFTKLAQWSYRVYKVQFLSFGIVARTIQSHNETILIYFGNRSTNVSAEFFNAKIKAFRASFRGVRNVRFFFRLRINLCLIKFNTTFPIDPILTQLILASLVLVSSVYSGQARC